MRAMPGGSMRAVPFAVLVLATDEAYVIAAEAMATLGLAALRPLSAATFILMQPARAFENLDECGDDSRSFNYKSTPEKSSFSFETIASTLDNKVGVSLVQRASRAMTGRCGYTRRRLSDD